MSRPADIARWLSLFVPPDQMTELRVLGTAGETWAGWFMGDDLPRMAATALGYEPRAKGIYFVPNPITPHGKSLEAARRGKGETTSDEMIARRRWLLIDVDPVRFGLDGKPLPDTNCPSTDAERESAWQVLTRCRAALDAFGLSQPVVGDSGNGWHLCYEIDLPNDEESRTLHKAVLVALESRSGDDRAHVDLKTFNAARIWKLYGTQARKGQQGDGRRWRYSQAVLSHEPPHPNPKANTSALRRAVTTWAAQDKFRAPKPSNDPTAYGKKALEQEIGRVMTAPPGTRNNTLNEAAFNLGTLVGGGVLDRSVVEASLTAAAAAAGLDRSESERTARSGLDAGVKKPRAPEPKQPHASAVPEQPAPNSEPKRPADEGITCYDLMAIDLPEPRYALQGLLPEGVTILAARPKMGKSWWALQLALAVANGSTALGSVPTERGDVLYLALEDTRRRLRKRVRKLLDATGWNPPRELEFRVTSERATTGGLTHLAKWLESHPNARLVIIDTLAKFRPVQKGKGDTYADDYEIISGLKNLADRHAVAVLLVHHSRKAAAESPFDEVSGTLGLTGAADACFVLQRTHGSNSASLYVTGRDVEEETITMKWDAAGCLWSIDSRQQGVHREPSESYDGKSDGSRVSACAQWLLPQLVHGSARQSNLITEAEMAGFSKPLFFRAIENTGCVKFDGDDGKKWVRLPDLFSQSK